MKIEGIFDLVVPRSVTNLKKTQKTQHISLLWLWFDSHNSSAWCMLKFYDFPFVFAWRMLHSLLVLPMNQSSQPVLMNFHMNFRVENASFITGSSNESVFTTCINEFSHVYIYSEDYMMRANTLINR